MIEVKERPKARSDNMAFNIRKIGVIGAVQMGSGLLAPGIGLALMAFSVVANVVFFALVRSGLATHGPDPGLGRTQLVVGVALMYASYATLGPAAPAPLITSRRSVTAASISIPVPLTSPSPCAAWASPTESSAPGASTGNRSVAPSVRCRRSRLPPLRRGGIVECCPGSSGATPITPQNGASGTRMPGLSVVYEPSRRSQKCW